MKKQIKNTLFGLLLLMLSTSSLKATHLMGSDIGWQCMGKDSFLITLTVYRDCNGVTMTNAYIPVRCKSTGHNITSIGIALPVPVDITPVCDALCSRCSDKSCSFPFGIEEYKYQKLVYLGSSASYNCCELCLSYTMCCRNATITTGAASMNYYIEAMMNRCISPCDNAPVFNNPPIILTCIGQDINYNHGVYDTDMDLHNGGLLDSLSYEWTEPLAYSGGKVFYTGNYDYEKPIYFYGFPQKNLPSPRGFHLDSLTGDISFRPMKLEQTVMALKVSEFRYDSNTGKRVLIGQIRRDIQVIVVNCPVNKAPVLSGPYSKEVCVGDTVSFIIPTYDADSGDVLNISAINLPSGSIWSDNNGKVDHPTGVLTWIPTKMDISSIPYMFSVSVEDNACYINGKTIQNYQILVGPQPEAELTVVDSGCGKHWFFAKPLLGFKPTYQWTGSFFENPPVQGQTVFHHFIQEGSYPYSMTMSANGCQRTYYDTLLVDTFLKLVPAEDVNICEGDTAKIFVQYKDNRGCVSFRWSTSLNDTNASKIFEVFKDTTIVYSIQDSTNCILYDTVKINMAEIPVPGVFYDHNILWANQGFMSYQWYRNDTLLSDTGNFIKPKLEGVYELEVYNQSGCSNSEEIKVALIDAKVVKVYPNPVEHKLIVKTSQSLKSVELLDMSGKRVFEKHNIDDIVIEINMSEQTAELYILKVQLDNDTEVIHMILKK